MKWIIFSLRNTLKQRQRSLLNIIAIGINLSIIIIYVCIMRGYYFSTKDRIIDYQTGHAQIHHELYDHKAFHKRLDETLPHAQQITRRIQQLPAVKAVGQRILFKGQLSNGMDRLFVQAIGLEPQAETQIGILHDNIAQGQYLGSGNQVLVGAPLAKKLHVTIGDSLLLYSQTKTGVHNLIELTIQGLFEMGFSMVDNGVVYLPLKTAQSFLQFDNEATSIIIKKNANITDDALMLSLKEALPHEPVQINLWSFFAEAFLADIQNGLAFMILLFGILILLAIFTIVNTLSLTLKERAHEIGMLGAMGFSRSHINRLLMLEVTWLGLFGIGFAWLLGLGGSLYFTLKGISYGQAFANMTTIPWDGKLVGQIGPEEFMFTGLLGLITVWMGCYIPIRRATRKPITDLLRQTL